MRPIAPVLALLSGLIAFPAAAQVRIEQSSGAAKLPPGLDPETGARPGNEIGTGQSLPKSDKAGNIAPEGARSIFAPNLPSPPIGDNASPRRYLMAARDALGAGRTGEAQQALEMAETRALDRSVPLLHTADPIVDPLVESIRNALLALGANDRTGAMKIIEAAIAKSAD